MKEKNTRLFCFRIIWAPSSSPLGSVGEHVPDIESGKTKRERRWSYSRCLSYTSLRRGVGGGGGVGKDPNRELREGWPLLTSLVKPRQMATHGVRCPGGSLGLSCRVACLLICVSGPKYKTLQLHMSLTEQQWHIERKQNNEFSSRYHPIWSINYSIF